MDDELKRSKVKVDELSTEKRRIEFDLNNTKLKVTRHLEEINEKNQEIENHMEEIETFKTLEENNKT